MISFDFQQNLPTPNLHHNDVFYTRQLWTYNFGIHDCVADKGYMYMWDKTVAKCASSQVASCLKNLFQGARVLDLWFLFLMGTEAKTKILLLLASAANFILGGSMTFLTINSLQGATPSSGTTLTSPKLEKRKASDESDGTFF